MIEVWRGPVNGPFGRGPEGPRDTVGQASCLPGVSQARCLPHEGLSLADCRAKARVPGVQQRSPRMNKRLNVRLLLQVGIALVVLGTVTHLLHAFQVGRQARAFRAEGYRAAEEKDFERSAVSLHRYLALRPDDLEARLKYGVSLGRVAATPAARERAYRYLETSLRKGSDNVEARETLGHLAVQLGRFRDAARHLEPLRDAPVDRAELEQ